MWGTGISYYFHSICTETLQIKDAGEADAGSYDCIVENEIGTESSTQSAKVYVKGKFTLGIFRHYS